MRTFEVKSNLLTTWLKMYVYSNGSLKHSQIPNSTSSSYYLFKNKIMAKYLPVLYLHYISNLNKYFVDINSIAIQIKIPLGYLVQGVSSKTKLVCYCYSVEHLLWTKKSFIVCCSLVFCPIFIRGPSSSSHFIHNKSFLNYKHYLLSPSTPAST